MKSLQKLETKIYEIAQEFQPTEANPLTLDALAKSCEPYNLVDVKDAVRNLRSNGSLTVSYTRETDLTVIGVKIRD